MMGRPRSIPVQSSLDPQFSQRRIRPAAREDRGARRITGVSSGFHAHDGKTIRIYLADGEPTGILLAEISNWTGKVLVAPRSQLDQLSKREEVRRTGVYLLVGPDPDDPSRALASISEGDNVLRAAAPPELGRGQGPLGAHRRHDSTTRDGG